MDHNPSIQSSRFGALYALIYLVILVSLCCRAYSRWNGSRTATDCATTLLILSFVVQEITQVGWKEEECRIVDVIKVRMTSSAKSDRVL